MRATASLSLRLPRGRPPAVGVDPSVFNLTPPSAEAVTPTNEEPKPVAPEPIVRAERPDYNPNPHS